MLRNAKNPFECVAAELSTASRIHLTPENTSRTNPKMLQVENPAVVHCLRRASECDRLAETAVDADARNTIRRMAERWRSLAENHEYIQRMEELLATRLMGPMSNPRRV